MSNLERSTKVVDLMTGEVISDSKQTISIKKLPDEPAYIKLYLSDIAHIYGLAPLLRDVLMHVAANMGQDGVASLTVRRKAAIRASLGCSAGALDNALSALNASGLIERVARGEYAPNPLLFGRGKWAEIRERREAFAMRVTYSPNGERSVSLQKLTPDEIIRAELERRGQKCLIDD